MRGAGVIAVIADDLTGAAEIGGVGLHYGLTAEVQTGRYRPPRSDLVVFDTSSRSLSRNQARTSVRKAASAVRPMAAQTIYKKVDSAMRGHLLAELEALLVGLGRDRALLIPANPTLGRTIAKGKYLVGGTPLHETDFSRDPEHPITTSKVLDLLGESDLFKVSVLEDPQSIPRGTIAIGCAESWDDLLTWVARLEPSCLPAGASDFFAAVLESQDFRVAARSTVAPSRGLGKSLFVCGSRSDCSRRAVLEAERQGLPVSWMPPEMIKGNAERHLNRWAATTSGLLDRHPLAIVALGRLPDDSGAALARRLRDYTAALVKKVLRKTSVQQLYIEGGATSSGIVRALRWHRFHPVEELSRGVVRMQVDGEGMLHVTVKPGSYPWPEGVLLHSGHEG